ncbi:unnamed protein product [Cuscuta europaea]|uniref:Integrase catalytic domain-containing protein n=1 Tax=Cuscuta europaea TaxID=41803 RepID=A0A9P0YVL2_CUSEU|nr:unnamed protein product [Cuscuta europaea]
MKTITREPYSFRQTNKDSVYPFPATYQPPASLALKTTLVSGPVWHNRLGHCGDHILLSLTKNKFISSTSTFSHDCVSCKLGKSHRIPFQDVIHNFIASLQLIHSYVWQSPILSNLEFKYYVSFIDDFSRFTWVYPMHKKSEVFTHFCNFQNLVENLFDCKIKCFQSDGGGEFVNSSFQNHFLKCGILFRKSCPDTPAQNGVAERKHRHLLELARTLLQEAKLPPTFWVDALYTATYIINRLPTSILRGLSSFEILFQKSPDYNFFRVFGCACFPNFVASSSNKLSPRSIMCVFLGYAPGYKGYGCLNPRTGRVYIIRDVVFHETSFPYSDLCTSTSSSLPAALPPWTLPTAPLFPPTSTTLPAPPSNMPETKSSTLPTFPHAATSAPPSPYGTSPQITPSDTPLLSSPSSASTSPAQSPFPDLDPSPQQPIPTTSPPPCKPYGS